MFSSRNLLLALLAFAAWSCDAPPDPRRTNFKIEKDGISAQYDEQSGKLKKIDADLNKNGRMETFSYWDATKVSRVEIDRNEDGKIDRWEHYDGDAQKVVSIGASSKDDGVEDMWTYLDDAGRVARIEFDSNRDGRIDKRDIYGVSATGLRAVLVVESQFDESGVPHKRMHYRPDGTFEGVDTTKE